MKLWTWLKAWWERFIEREMRLMADLPEPYDYFDDRLP